MRNICRYQSWGKIKRDSTLQRKIGIVKHCILSDMGTTYFFDSTWSQKVFIPTQLMTHNGFPRIDLNQLTTRNGFLEFSSNRLMTQKASRILI